MTADFEVMSIAEARALRQRAERAERERDAHLALLQECAQALIDCTHPGAPQLSTDKCQICALGRRIDAAINAARKEKP